MASNHAKKLKLSDEESVTGYVHNVSPVKISAANNKYFEATLQMQNDYHKIVYFSPEKRNMMSNVEKDKTGLKLVNIRKDLNYQNPSTYDILANNRTATLFTELPFTYLPPPKLEAATVEEIKQTASLMQNVSVQGKIMTKENPTTKTVKGSAVLLSNCTIADKTGSMKLALWADDIQKITLGKCYFLENLLVKEFDEKYLSMTKRSMLKEISDIGPVKENKKEDTRKKVTGPVEMVSVSMTTHCGSCYKTITEPLTSKVLIKCTACTMKQKVSALKKTLSMNIKLQNDETKYIVGETEICSFLSAKHNKDLAKQPEELEDFMLTLKEISFFTSENRVTEFHPQ